MKQQVIFLSGWTPKENFLSYYDALEKQDYDIYEKEFKNYKYSLWENLWENYEYHRIPFPNRYYADYEAWKIVFEKIVPYMRNELIFIATSLWWSFICKYLSENTFDKKIAKLIMLAPAFYDNTDEAFWTFLPDTLKFDSINTQCDEIIIYHSIDDEIVLFSDSVKYLKLFPNARFRKFTDKWHFFNEQRIIELEEDIKK